jgi:uncharacterized protein (DUF924 family)
MLSLFFGATRSQAAIAAEAGRRYQSVAMDDAQDVLDYWFGAPGSPEFGAQRPMWFRGGPEVDRVIRDRFTERYHCAAAGECDHWLDEAGRALALVVVLDQFPRHIYRGQAPCFAADAKARAVARRILERGYDRTYLPVHRPFAYLPFGHSEDLEDQKLHLELCSAIEGHPDRQKMIDFAVLHLRIIEQFGRFPHRNVILGRESTAAELAYLASTDERFGTDGKVKPAPAAAPPA